MLQVFRVVSFLEGLSYLVILSVTLGFITRELVFVLGMVHGALFIAYFVCSLLVSHRQGWSVLLWLAILLAAIVPFAFLPVEVFLQKALKKSQGTTV